MGQSRDFTIFFKDKKNYGITLERYMTYIIF